MTDAIAIFGDVHGEAKLLRKLITKIREKFSDIDIYTLGDLIDRGPDSKEVIQICIDEKISGVYGNHESWLKELVESQKFNTYCLNAIMGGKATLESYGVDCYSDGHNYFPNGRNEKILAVELYRAIPDDHKAWIKKLHPYFFVDAGNETFWLIHAGLTNSVAESHKCKSDHLMMRKIVDMNDIDSILWPSPSLGNGPVTKDNLYHFKNDIQIFGHKPVKAPLIKDHFIALDTGCGTCEPYTLSAIILPSREIIQVRADE